MNNKRNSDLHNILSMIYLKFKYTLKDTDIIRIYSESYMYSVKFKIFFSNSLTKDSNEEKVICYRFT